MEPTPALGALQVALEANAAAYRRAVQTSAPGDCWDYLILTAANEKQAQGYRQELALRERAVGPAGAFFPAIQRSIVVPDPPGRRAGSGGATLGAVRALLEQFRLQPQDLARLRILLIHSGGASQRLPAYSPLGKIFAPLPLLRPDAQIATLFDHLYLTLAGLPERLGPGLLVLAGDVFLLLDHRHVTPPPPGVTAISMRVDADLGRGHGVFVTDAQNRILHTLQKVPVEAMRRHGATDALGRVLIDTGLLFFDALRTQTLAHLAGCRGPRRGQSPRGLHQQYTGQIDLYEDMTLALARGTRQHQYLSDPASGAMRRQLWRTLHGVPFHVMQLDGEFLHLGTTLQFRDAMVGRSPSPAAELFQQNVLAHSQWRLEPGRRVYHSALLGADGQSGAIGPGAVVEHSILRSGSRIGAGSVVSQVIAQRRPIELGENLLLFQVPVKEGSGFRVQGSERGAKAAGLRYVQVLCGVEDDFKGLYGEGKCRYLNRPINEWMERHRLSAQDLWPGMPREKRTLWTARLFAATEQRDMADGVLWMAGDSSASRRLVQAWRKAPHYSMAMILEQADPAALIEHRETVSAHLQASEFIDSIQRGDDTPIEAVLGHYSTAAAYRAAQRLLCEWADADSPDANLSLDQARALWAVAQLLQRPDHPAPQDARPRIDSFMNSAFAKVAEASEIGHRSIQVQSRQEVPPRLSPGVEVEATAPVRLDLTGGWSDTPPYCFERGGHVVNVAIDLDGRPPVRVILRSLPQSILRLESHDLGRQVELPILDHVPLAAIDVRDPFALHKIAIDMAGLLRTSADSSRRPLAGLHVITECRVPKGSGLGTSSILAAVLLAALHKLVTRRDASASQLIEQTLLLEQRLSTGGGWQDQVGGIVGGVKSTVTAPGVPQRPVVEMLPLSDAQYEALQKRLVVYYSGQQRLARDILRRVEGRWLAREPAVRLLKDELKASAAAMRTALLRSQWNLVGREIGRYWQLKKDLYPGSTTPTIDVLLLELRQHYVSAGLAGAGGGGFAYFFCKDAAQARRLRELLAERSARPGSLGNVYETQINRTGLSAALRPPAPVRRRETATL